jgi:hypothetical protein
MKTTIDLLMCIFSTLFIFSTQEKPLINEKCSVYKVIYDKGKMIDSFLFQSLILNEKNKPLSEVAYLQDASIDHKKEYVYKDSLLTESYNKRPGETSEKIVYTYNPSRLITKYQMFNGRRLSTEKHYVYEGDKIKEIVEYECENNNLKLISREIRSYDTMSRIVKENIINKSGDTTFKSEYTYDNKVTGYIAYGSDGKEIESHKAYFNASNFIVQKIFYKSNRVVMKENYNYDEDGRLLKKVLQNLNGEFIRSEEFKYTGHGNKSRTVKTFYLENRREIINYITGTDKISTEEYWNDDNLEVKLYYNYSSLR